MGGQQGSRGYIYQGIISVFNAFTTNEWEKISVEYTTEKDKVDIALLTNNDQLINAIQVKSSINLFTKADIIKWVAEIISDAESEEYQLILIGNCEANANVLIKSIDKLNTNNLDQEARDSLGEFGTQITNKNVKVLLMPFDEEHLMGIIRDSLNRFISYKGYTINYTSLEEICYALVALSMFLGTKGQVLSKTDYERHILDWLISSANGDMTKNSREYSALEIKVFNQVTDTIVDEGESLPFPKNPALVKIRDSIIAEGKELISQIDKIKLSAYNPVEKTKSESIKKKQEHIGKYAKGELPKFNLDSWFKETSAELSDKEKIDVIESVKKYWEVTVSNDFFYVGNLTETITSLPFGSRTLDGTDIEKHKDDLICELKSKILNLKCIDYFIDIFKDIHILPLCITNTSDVSDDDITISFTTKNGDFRIFRLNEDVSENDREMLDVLADTLIDDKIIEEALCVKSTANITVEPEKWVAPPPFIMPDPFGYRQRFNFEDLIGEWETYQAEECQTGIITYEISSLRPGETKWLSPYTIIIPANDTISIKYTILSRAAGERIVGDLTIKVDKSI